MSHFSRAVMLCLLAIAPSASVEANEGPLVVFKVVEEVETQPMPVSQAEGKLVDELATMIENRERETARALKRRDDVDQFLSSMSYGGGTDQHNQPDTEAFTKSLGRMQVVPESGGFGGWVSRQLGMDTTPELPTFEEHIAGVAKVQSSFIAERNSIISRHNGVNIHEAAERVAVVVHAEADGKQYETRPIHLTVEELAELAKDPKKALDGDLGKLIRSAYQNQIVGAGRTDHTGIEPVVAVHAIYGPGGRYGDLVAMLPNSLLARGKGLDTLGVEEMNRALFRRSQKQFERERLARIRREAEEAAAKTGGDAKGLGGNLTGLPD